VNDRDKHGGLQRYRMNYGRKNVYLIPAAKETDFKMKRNVKVKEDKDKKRHNGDQVKISSGIYCLPDWRWPVKKMLWPFIL